MDPHRLPTVESIAAAPVRAREAREYPPVSEAGPADQVMVDFCREYAVTVEPRQHLDAALEQMQRAGMRALLGLPRGG